MVHPSVSLCHNYSQRRALEGRARAFGNALNAVNLYFHYGASVGFACDIIIMYRMVQKRYMWYWALL
jgi:hypothetical protein